MFFNRLTDRLGLTESVLARAPNGRFIRGRVQSWEPARARAAGAEGTAALAVAAFGARMFQLNAANKSPQSYGSGISIAKSSGVSHTSTQSEEAVKAPDTGVTGGAGILWKPFHRDMAYTRRKTTRRRRVRRTYGAKSFNRRGAKVMYRSTETKCQQISQTTSPGGNASLQAIFQVALLYFSGASFPFLWM